MDEIKFIDNSAITAQLDKYLSLEVAVPKILESWRSSLHAFQWIGSDGRIKSLDELPESEKTKRAEVEERINNLQPIEKPVLGIGLLENVEIGMGRATFLTLAAHGVTVMPVHIRKSNQDEFKPFLAG